MWCFTHHKRWGSINHDFFAPTNILRVHIASDQTSANTAGALDGARKTVTALFADIKGSTELMRDLDVSTAVKNFPKSNSRLPFVNLIFPAVKQARAIVKKNGGDPAIAVQVIPVAINQNVILTVDHLRKEFVNSEGKLLVAGGVYHLGTQFVKVLTQ